MSAVNVRAASRASPQRSIQPSGGAHRAGVGFLALFLCAARLVFYDACGNARRLPERAVDPDSLAAIRLTLIVAPCRSRPRDLRSRGGVGHRQFDSWQEPVSL